LLDGAMGTNLIALGVNTDILPDVLNLENPDIVKKIIKGYIDAGSDIIRTNTFSTIRPRLRHFGLENRISEIAKAGVFLCRSLIKDKRYLAVSIGPSGEFLPPSGNASFDEIYEYYYEVARIYDSEGADIFWLETFTDIYELKTAIIAIKDASRLPVVALMTFDENMRSVFGSTPQIMASVVSGLGIDALGANCSLGSEGILNIIAEMRGFVSLPLVAQPNAGMPVEEGGKICYPETPRKMASYTKDLIENGVRIIGACCGSTAEHIAEIKKELEIVGNRPFNPASLTKSLFLTSRSSLVQISDESFPVIIGERINPTNKKHLIEGLKIHDYTAFLKEASQQADAGADVLDVNAGSAVADESVVLPEIVKSITAQTDIPLSIDTTNDIALENALKNTSGRPLINSIKDDSSLDYRLSLAKKYGAAFIILTLGEKGIPGTAGERIKIAGKIMERASGYGFDSDDMLFDFLTLSAATSVLQIRETLDAISEFSSKGFFTVLGVSNVSYGLPQRSYINSAFLSFAIMSGLKAAIIDPLDRNILASFYAAASLMGYDRNFSKYINFGAKHISENPVIQEAGINPLLKLSNAIISGQKEDAIRITEELLLKKTDYKRIISDGILRAMKDVGIKFKANQIFLPQVMLSAESAQAAFDIIMKSTGDKAIERKGRIVIATVEGDIHDLGKNLVSAVLRNSGFEVIDLGKNICADVIVQKARENEADIIGLSALMTTTMGRMREVVALLKENQMNIPVLIGGAVVTELYANEIGAYYGRDAVEAVIIAEEILRKRR
ncbi:MAG: homocysteine S-methyltransferase family protein, partial [Deltaproteobacteria bacterium]|nr:homocysteine S-methyltransferase family protein [Deltaproteobacteria bacterium]